MRLLTGKELRFAAENRVPVHYIEKHYNPMDKHMEYDGVCIMEPAIIGYYIGNTDIEPDYWENDVFVQEDFDAGIFSVFAVPGEKYE